MAQKPKAWRGLAVITPGSKRRCVQEYPCPRKHYNCTVIPDGATVPLPASVRRVLRKIGDFKRTYRSGQQRLGLYKALDLMALHDAHERAVAKRRRG